MNTPTTSSSTSTKPTVPGQNPDSSSIPLEGTMIGGRYRMERLIGIGGMGIVVAARDVETDRLVALKCLAREALDDAELVDRFEREARAFARIHGDHVARIFDVGKTDDGRPYIVLEYLEGKDLARFLARRTPLPIREVVRWIVEACEGVAAAHAANIVHRDIKPANLFLAKLPDGTSSIKVLDFGISKLTDDPVTKTKRLLGTAIYMSPEQLRSSRGVDHRSDVWALGVVLYELLSGQAPFPGRNVPEIVERVREATPIPLRERRADVPPELELIVARCLRCDRDERYASASDLAADLRPLLESDLADEPMPESCGALEVWPRPPSGRGRTSAPRAIPIVRRSRRTKADAKKKASRKRRRYVRPGEPADWLYVPFALAMAAVLATIFLLRDAAVERPPSPIARGHATSHAVAHVR